MSKRKKKSNAKTCFIPKNGGMSWKQYEAQKENIERTKKESDEYRKRTGK